MGVKDHFESDYSSRLDLSVNCESLWSGPLLGVFLFPIYTLPFIDIELWCDTSIK